MSRIKLALVVSGALFAFVVIACEEPAATTPPPAAPMATASADPYAAYYPPASATAPAPAGYPPGVMPTAAPTATAPMATPGPLALPCTADSACIMARCNTQYGKCAFPCQSAADCATGASCNAMSGLCLPGG